MLERGKYRKDWRYERKFIVDDLIFDQIEDSIIGNSYLFKKIYNVRQVNNVYFDDIHYRAYYSNIEGLSERKKYRIRWYGELLGEIKNPVLEVKVKKSSLGTKFHFNINTFIMKPRFDPNIFTTLFKESDEYHAMVDRLEDIELNALSDARRGGPFVEVGLAEL